MEDRLTGRGAQALVLALASILLLARLGGIDLWAPDEPRYAQIAEEVRAFERGPASAVLLTLNGHPYDQKPPLYFCLAALAGAAGGRVTETAARLPSALAGIALVALVLAWGSRLFGRCAAALGGAILATAVLFPYMARRTQIDLVLALFESLALLGFWRADRGIGSRRASLALLHASMGLAVLTKGPVGLLVPSLVIVAYLVWERRPAALRAVFPPWGLALSLLPGILWVALAIALAPQGFFEGAVVENLYGRFFLGTSKANPWYFFFGVFPLDFLPWSLLWPVVWIVGRREIFAPGAPDEPRRTWRFLLAWVVVTFVFFSISTGKRNLYLLPCYPAVALLCGDAAYRALRRLPALPRAVGRSAAGLAIAIGTAALAAAALPLFPGVDVPFAFAAAVIAALAAGAALWRGAAIRGKGALGQLAAALVATFAVELSIFTLLFPALDAQKSPRPLALAAAALSPPGTPIGVVEQSPVVGGIAYYSHRPVAEVAYADDLRGFFDGGGRVAVIREQAFERVHGEQYAEIRARVRSGKRATLVVTPRTSIRGPAASAEAATMTAESDGAAAVRP